MPNAKKDLDSDALPQGGTLDREKGHSQNDDRGQTLMLAEKVSTFIPICKTHAPENHGIIPLEIIEEKSGSYLGEDDIVRVEDRYGRQSNYCEQGEKK